MNEMLGIESALNEGRDVVSAVFFFSSFPTPHNFDPLQDMDVKRWEELKKQARSIEGQIDSKLLELGNQGSSSANDHDSSEKSSLLVESSVGQWDRTSREIESLLDQLTRINNDMSELSDQLKTTPSATYQLQRHREVLNDYVKEFRKTKINRTAQIERKQLLTPNNGVKETVVNIYSRNAEIYAREATSIRNSERIVDDSINIALKTKENLRRDRGTFKAIHSQMTTLANRFPLINSLIHRINLKKRKDTIVLGSVIGTCLFLLLIYIF